MAGAADAACGAGLRGAASPVGGRDRTQQPVAGREAHPQLAGAGVAVMVTLSTKNEV
jgi:hypothetical protein